jgi:hypothetical protein
MSKRPLSSIIFFFVFAKKKKKGKMGEAEVAFYSSFICRFYVSLASFIHSFVHDVVVFPRARLKRRYFVRRRPCLSSSLSVVGAFDVFLPFISLLFYYTHNKIDDGGTAALQPAPFFRLLLSFIIGPLSRCFSLFPPPPPPPSLQQGRREPFCRPLFCSSPRFFFVWEMQGFFSSCFFFWGEVRLLALSLWRANMSGKKENGGSRLPLLRQPFAFAPFGIIFRWLHD